MMNCPVHGFAPRCITSPDLLDLRSDGTLPEVIVVEVGEYVTEMNFFRFNVSPEIAATLPIVNGCIPFDVDACETMDRFPDMCGFCFRERRQALKAKVESRERHSPLPAPPAQPSLPHGPPAG